MLRTLVLLVAVAPLGAQVAMSPPRPIVVDPIITMPSYPVNIDLDMIRSNAQLDRASAELARASADLARASVNLDGRLTTIPDLAYAPSPLLSDFQGFAPFNTAVSWNWDNGSVQVPAPWAREDPADSLYRSAREALNRGDYRRAANQFDDLVKRYPKSVYAKDAPYWQAFSLYRLGGTPDLTQALGLLEKWREANPPATPSEKDRVEATRQRGVADRFTMPDRTTGIVWTGGSESVFYTSSGGPDVDGLAARIAGVLASRGMADNAAVKKALAARGSACDSEDQAIRIAALSALIQSAPDQGRAQAARILARRDECSAPLRRNALLVLSTRGAGENSAAIIGVARNDPSPSVRLEAINALGHMPGDEAVNVLDELARSSDAQVQRAAVQALGASTNPRARGMLRAMVERTEVSENTRLSVIDAFLREKSSTSEDAAWLRGYYSRTTSVRTQERIAEVLGRTGGEANNQWLLDIARRESEPASVRAMALSRLGKTMDIASLGRFYETAPSRQMRESVIGILGSRSEPEAVDKLIDIAKNSTDPNNRRSAISVLARSKDPRAQKLLLDLVDR